MFHFWFKEFFCLFKQFQDRRRKGRSRQEEGVRRISCPGNFINANVQFHTKKNYPCTDLHSTLPPVYLTFTLQAFATRGTSHCRGAGTWLETSSGGRGRGTSASRSLSTTATLPWRPPWGPTPTSTVTSTTSATEL